MKNATGSALKAKARAQYPGLSIHFAWESAGVTADLDPPRIWTPGPDPLADMDPLSRIWTPLKTSVLLSKIGKIVFWTC